ncbi:Trans-2,3-dihydro-3-hydroxyanthranilate isomerase [Tsuneonella dongtanensis]|uniref:Trans-2,3-dihydro-3-hydroxyanthranilate isomerase n=1 Tax=Tsuneonella dongtanensis TaxID=692370 RepID=A0A1B2ACJ4_9SPHN|nr:PhzF family phenazine biosynthesis protein [Tsuneonella dongtanensis]ANY19866.1 Trans-2,3-dihydro-3-hydroxyanthranilate isomerase [Tsuneonella dongtanensis]
MRLDLVDVFGSGPLSGNPLAVVHGAEDLGDADMLRLTQWLGFSETTFLLPPTTPAADYRVRIFYPAGELPFAGHPTLGTCHAWLRAGGKPRTPGTFVQECGIGLVDVRGDGATLALAAPPFTRSGPLDSAERTECARLAGIDPASIIEAVHVANGPQWILLRLESAEQVLAATQVSEAPIGTDVGLAAPGKPGSGVDWELRAFFADQHGKLREDPVTGSFNAGVALHLFSSGLASGRYVAAQGRMTGADGRVVCEQDADGSVWIGGRCETVSSNGSLDLFS